MNKAIYVFAVALTLAACGGGGGGGGGTPEDTGEPASESAAPLQWGTGTWGESAKWSSSSK